MCMRDSCRGETKSDLGLLSTLGLSPEGTFCRHVCGPLIQQSAEGEEALPVFPVPPTPLPHPHPGSAPQLQLPNTLPLPYVESPRAAQEASGIREVTAGNQETGLRP